MRVASARVNFDRLIGRTKRSAIAAIVLAVLGCVAVTPASASSTSTGFTVWLPNDVTVPPPPPNKMPPPDGTPPPPETLVLSTTLQLTAGESRRISDRLGATLTSSEGAEVGNHILCLDPAGTKAEESMSGTNHLGSGAGEIGLMESLLLKAKVSGTYTCQILANTGDGNRTNYAMTAVRGGPPFMTTGTWLRISSSDEAGSHAWSNHECNSSGDWVKTCVYLGGSSSPRVAHVFSGQGRELWTAATDTTEVDIVGTFQITSCPYGTASCISTHWGDSGFLGLGKPGDAEFQSFLEFNQLNPDGSLCHSNRSDDDGSPSPANDVGRWLYDIRDSVHHLPVKYHLNTTVSPNCNGSRTFVLDLYVGWLGGNPIKLDNGGFNVIQSVHGATTTTVPHIVGLTEAQAGTAITANGLKPVTVERVMNPAAVGTVFAENSPAGTAEPRGSDVDLSVSLGQTTVPDVLSTDESSAIHAITTAGLAVGAISSVNDCLDPGFVKAQNPPADVLVIPGTSVSITIATCTSGGGNGPPIHPK